MLYEVCRPFRFNGHPYDRDDPFESDDDRRTRLLLEQRFIREMSSGGIITAEQATEVGYRIAHRGGPWFDVIGQNGEKLNDRAVKRDEAERLAEESAA